MYKKVNYDPIECNQCQSKFKPKTSHQNFCSKKCYKKYGRLYLGHSTGNKTAKLKRERPYRLQLKSTCEFCGFIPVNKCQLDVDHKDGNKLNNNPDNLQTLCANCHRLKTYLNKDWQQKTPAFAGASY